MTVGLFGGTFNPPHHGHVALAETAVQQLGLERLLVVVTGQTPDKEVDVDAETRLKLAAAAFEGRSRIEVSRLELDRPQPSYSVDTVRWAGEQGGEIVFVVGADRFLDFPTWREPERVLEYAKLAVATRPGFPRERLVDVLEQIDRIDRILFFEIEPLPISSTDVRRRVARGEAVDHLVPQRVADLIDELGLYR